MNIQAPTSSVGRLLGATVVDEAGDSIGEIEAFVISSGQRGTRAVVKLDEDARESQLVAVPFDSLHVDFSGEAAAAVPPQARVRVEALPAYEYPVPEPI